MPTAITFVIAVILALPNPACAVSEKPANCSELPTGTTNWGTSASGCKIPSDSAHGAVSPKGWELYSWREAGTWHYSLLPGTNRLKNEAELKASALADLEETERKIRALPPGAEIFWNSPAASAHLKENLKLERPARNSVDSRKIRALVQKLRLKLTD